MRSNGPNPIDKHVGSLVRMRRKMLGMSQTKLGDALGLTFQQIQKYEKGANRISASVLQKCSYILQVPVAFFFEGAPSAIDASKVKGTPQAFDYVTEFFGSNDGLVLAKAFMRIKDVQLRRKIVNLVQEIVGESA